MLNFFINQEQFFNNLDQTKYSYFKFNLCWLINVYIIIKNRWINVTETQLLEKSIELNAYDEIKWWKYLELTKLLNNFKINSKVFKWKLLHNYLLKKELLKLKANKNMYIASVNLDWENHLIIIDSFIDNFVFYMSVWTKTISAQENWKISYNEFKKNYNKRGILIYSKDQ